MSVSKGRAERFGELYWGCMQSVIEDGKKMERVLWIFAGGGGSNLVVHLTHTRKHQFNTLKHPLTGASSRHKERSL